MTTLTTITVTTSDALTMSSLDIATLTDKRHDHVVRDIRRMLEELEIDGPKFGGVYLDAKGEARPCFNLPKDLTLTLVSGYSVVLRKRIIDRWMELEAAKATAPAVPTTFAEALRLAAAEVERREEVEKKSLHFFS